MPWVLGWQWEICLCAQHSIKLPVNEFVFNRAVRDGTGNWFQVEGFFQMKSAVAWPDSTSRVLSRFTCRVWGPEKTRLICKCRKGDLALQFPAFKADVFNLFRESFLGSLRLGVGLWTWTSCISSQLHTFLLTELLTLGAAVRVDLLSTWSPLPYASWDVLSSFVWWLDESTIKSTNN